MLTDIRAALTRKFGPLPAWAWLTIFAGAVYLWRRRSGGGVAAATQDTGTSGDTSAPEPQEPITLGPGESAYNPNTGQLVTGSPATPDTSGNGPIIIGPGETAYDPATGKIIPGQTAEPDGSDAIMPVAPPPNVAQPAKKLGPLGRAKAAVLTGKVGPKNRQRLHAAGYTSGQIAYHTKRKTALGKPAAKKQPKPKPQHSQHTSPVKHPTKQKTRTRAAGAIRHTVARARAKTPHPATTHAPKPRAKPTAAKPTARSRPTVTRAPVQRQRPEPAHTTPRKPTPKRRR